MTSIPREIRTDRLLLRPWSRDDAAELQPILVRDVPHLKPWIPAAVAEPASVPELAIRLAGFAADFVAERAWRFALWDAAANELLGEVDLFPRNASERVALADADRAEVGYWLRSDRTGHGLATEAVEAIIGAAAELPRFTQIEIRCDAQNVRSAALPARLGFHRYSDPAHGSESSTASAGLAVWTLPLGEPQAATDRWMHTHTGTSDVPAHEYCVTLAGRGWSILHAGALIDHDDEQRYLGMERARQPYGTILWPAAIALAHDIDIRAERNSDEFRACNVLELGAGTGLPGLITAALGASVIQTDRDELAMSICRANGERNGASGIEYRMADWSEWHDSARYQYILGADILYSPNAREHLLRIFDCNLAPGGRILLADPFRSASIRLLESMEQDGWRVAVTRWSINGGATPRPVGTFELTRS